MSSDTGTPLGLRAVRRCLRLRRELLDCRGRARPLFAPAFDIPRNSRIDARLVGGAAIFGVGWGLAGFCPGPALASLSLGLPGSFVFVATMLLGMVLARIVPGASARRDLKTEVGYGHPA